MAVPPFEVPEVYEDEDEYDDPLEEYDPEPEPRSPEEYWLDEPVVPGFVSVL